VTVMVTIKAGHDAAYFTNGDAHGGCVGAVAYYTGHGDPPGRWGGKAAAAMGLAGIVDPQVFLELYQERVGPDGELLMKRKQAKDAQEREDAAVAAFRKAHPFASAPEIAQVRAGARGKNPDPGVPYHDVNVSVVKSVSLLHASLRVAAQLARDAGRVHDADELDGEASGIEADLMASAEVAVNEAEQQACYTRTGHHSSVTGEWRDGAGWFATYWMHYINRDGDPDLHVHVPIANLVQREDGGDDKWRNLDAQFLYSLRLSIAATAAREMGRRLRERGYVLVPRADGNGFEVGGVSREVIDLFSSRRRAISAKLQKLIDEYTAEHGEAPSRRTVYLLGKLAENQTRQPKAKAKRTIGGKLADHEPSEAERMAAWEKQTRETEVQALSRVHQDAKRYADGHGGNGVLTEEAKARAARIAVAEVQKHHTTWSRAELRFEVHRALGPEAATEDVDQVADLATSGRCGTDVVQATGAPDIIDVSSLDLRKDGVSIYRRPLEARWTTVEHLDMEEHIKAEAQRTVRQRVTEEQAREVLEGTDLSDEQKEAVVRLLTTTRAMTILTAAAGAGKTHTVAAFAHAWTRLTSRRVIGLTTSENAARVMTNEGLAESYNVAAFLGKCVDSDELRRPVPLHEGDVLMLDESSQLSTSDLALIQQAAREAGALIIPTGDLRQLGPVEAGGMLADLAELLGVIELTEVRRFTAGWERTASVRLGEGELAVLAGYDLHGRIRGADREAAYRQAVSMWLADHLAGKDALLLAGSNEEAAELSRAAQAKLVQLGRVGAPCVQLSDGNQAGAGDLVRARLNTHIDAAGQRLTNRDVLKITGVHGGKAEVQRQLDGGGWSGKFRVPLEYLGKSAELGYAGNVYTAQGKTADTAQLLFTETLSRQSAYVGMTRGREANIAHVVTGETAAQGHEPLEQTAPEAVIAGVLRKDSRELSATEQIRQAQEWAGGTGHLLNLWSASVKNTTTPDIDKALEAALSEYEYTRYLREHQRPVLQQALRERQLSGQDISEVIAEITAGPLTGAKSVSAVLHGRLKGAPKAGEAPLTWAGRTLSHAPQIAHEAAREMDARAAELGQRQLEKPEPWLADLLGMPPHPDASPLLREDYARRAGVGAAYREAAGITDPQQAISADPHAGNPELERMRADTIRELQIPDEEALLRAASRGELEADVQAGERVMATAPPDHGAKLRLTSQAEADAKAWEAEALAVQDAERARNSASLAKVLAAEKAGLEAAAAKAGAWSRETAEIRDRAGKAKAELQRRGPKPEPVKVEAGAEPVKAESEADWWAELEAGVSGAERALEAEHAKAEADSSPWPPEPRVKPQEASHREAQEAIGRLVRDGLLPAPEEEAEPTEEAKGEAEAVEPAGQGARIDGHMQQIRAAAESLAAERDARQTRMDTRPGYEAQAGYETQTDSAEIEV